MNERLAALDHRVAAAADAWLTDPRDAGVYARLVAAVEARRAYLNPTLGEAAGEHTDDQRAPTPDDLAAPWGSVHHDELLDELADTAAPVPISEALHGDPRTVVTRLRGNEQPVDGAGGAARPSGGQPS